MKVFLRKLHRWLGLLMALQIIAWMVSGLYFSLVPINEIRGSHLYENTNRLIADDLKGLRSVSDAIDVINEDLNNPLINTVSVMSDERGVYFRISGVESEQKSFTRLVDARTGELMQQISHLQAQLKAQAMLSDEGKLKSIELITEAEAGGEYRGKTLPAWRVSFSEPESVNIYLDAWTGELTAARTNRWRIFDFLWMLHIMDFSERDDFNHGLLQWAAALGLVVALSGLVFWMMTTRLFRRRKPVTDT